MNCTTVWFSTLKLSFARYLSWCCTMCINEEAINLTCLERRIPHKNSRHKGKTRGVNLLAWWMIPRTVFSRWPTSFGLDRNISSILSSCARIFRSRGKFFLFVYIYGFIEVTRVQNNWVSSFQNFLQQSVILEKKGIKVGFLGYCDVYFQKTHHDSCLKIRKTYKAGPAIYSNRIAKRDVQHLKVK